MIQRNEDMYSHNTVHPQMDHVYSSTSQKPYIGIAIFYRLGDILNATIITRQIRADNPNAHIVCYTAERYAFALEGNPDIDEVVALKGDPFKLDEQIEHLRTLHTWDAFYVPAPYLAYNKLPGGDLTELMLATYDHPITVPLRPVIVLSESEVERARQWWSQLPNDRPRILVETEFYSQQSPWDRSYALAMVESLKEHRPIFVFTAKNRPPYLDELIEVYPDCIWCNLPFRLNAELYNLCDAFIGVSSAISCLVNSTWCRDDVPHIEVVHGLHWSTWHFKHHTHRHICVDREAFDQALTWLSSFLRGNHQQHYQQTLRDLYLRHSDGKYHWLSPALLPSNQSPISHVDALRAIARILNSLEPFYLCYGGIGDFLLALSTALEFSHPITVLASPNSIAAARAFFDCFPQIERVYFLERPPNSSENYYGGLFLRSATTLTANCLGRGVTPPAREDDFWIPGLDIVRDCGVTLYPQWVQRYRSERIEQPQIVLAPMGSIHGMFRSKRNIIPPQYWESLLSLFRMHGIRTIIIGTPDEAGAYPSDGWAHDRRSNSFEEQFRILASADLVVAADSWHKTFAAMAGVSTIVFQPLTNHDLDFWQDSSRFAFLAPWPNITVVHSWNDACTAIAQQLSSRANVTLEWMLPTPPREHPRRTNSHQPLTSFHPLFWERDYQSAQRVLVRMTDAIGDSLMVTAVVHALKNAYPHIAITVATTRHATEIFRDNPDIERCILANTTEDLRSEAAADIVVDYRFLLDQMPEYYGILPMMDILANIAGVRLPRKKLYYFPSVEEQRTAAERIGQRRALAIHLETQKDPFRTYPHAAELVRTLINTLPDYCLVWLGTTPSPVQSPSILDASKFSLREQIALTETCIAAIVIDSAFFHVAHNLYKKPTLLIAGPTSEYLIGDYTAAPLVTLRSQACSPCYWNVQRCKRLCTHSLDPSNVASTVRAFLDRVERGILQTIPPPQPTILRCIWDSLQRDLYTQCMRFRAAGAGHVRLHIVEATEPLPPYADHWNGVELVRRTQRQSLNFMEIFQQ